LKAARSDRLRRNKLIVNILNAILMTTPAALAAGVVVFISRWFKKPDWNVLIALGVAWVTAFALIAGWPGVIPRERWQWMLPLGVLAVVGAIVIENLANRRHQPWAVVVIAAFMGLMLQPPPVIDHPLAWRFLFGAAILLDWGLTNRWPRPASNQVLSIGWFVLFSGVSMLSFLAHFPTLSLLAGSLANVALLMLLLPRIGMRVEFMRIQWPCVALFIALLLHAWMYRQGAAPPLSFGLLAITPLALILPLRFDWVRLALCAASAGIAVIVAWRAAPPDWSIL